MQRNKIVTSGEEQPIVEYRRQRRCPSCGAPGLIRGCRVPGVQLQVTTDEGGLLSDPIGLYSDVCAECGLTSFYARRREVGNQLKRPAEQRLDTKLK